MQLFISHSATFCNINVHACAHICYKMVHCGIWDSCIVGFVRLVLVVACIGVSLESDYRFSWLTLSGLHSHELVTTLRIVMVVKFLTHGPLFCLQEQETYEGKCSAQRDIWNIPMFFVFLCLIQITEAEWRIYALVNLPSLVQIMASGLVGTKPLSEPMLKYC